MKIRVAVCQVDMEWEHTARNLAKSATDQMMYIIRGFEHGGISGLHIISGRFAETLGDVHIVPVGQGG